MISVEQSQLAALRTWLDRSRRTVANRLRDARSHADAGRMADAADRLDELERSLADEVLGPARGQFYHAAFRDQKRILDRDIIDHTVAPTAASVIAAKTALIGGRDQYRAMGALIDDAGDELKLASGIVRPDPKTRAAYHDEWERRHRDAITGEMHGALSDAQISLHNAVGFLLIKPEIR